MSSGGTKDIVSKNKRQSSPLPEPLGSFTSNDLGRLIVEEVVLKENTDGVPAGNHKMVTGFKITTSEGIETIVRFGRSKADMNLKNDQWRKLGAQMGLTYCSRKTTVSIRIGLAIHAQQETIIQGSRLIPVEGEKSDDIEDDSPNTNNTRYSKDEIWNNNQRLVP
jgi:hypothetical protein